MRARVLTGLVGIPLLVVIIWFGSPWLMLLVLAVSLAALVELYRLMEKAGAHPSLAAGALMAIATVLAFQFHEHLGGYLLAIAAGALSLSLLWNTFSRGRGGFSDWACTVAGVLYVSFLLSHVLPLSTVGEGSEGRNWVMFALFTTFAADTGAFFTGLAIGRHAMAPGISPNKTWEGAAGGLAWAVGIAVALGAALRLPVPLWQQALLGLAVGIFGQLGDLVESRIKRAAQVKEAGFLIPGHGGVLDRLDSVAFTVPMVYYLVVLAFGR